MNVERIKQIQQICSRLATLESDQEAARIADQDVSLIYQEMKYLRIKLQDLMNNTCPVTNTTR